jgi:hypothetical protein
MKFIKKLNRKIWLFRVDKFSIQLLLLMNALKISYSCNELQEIVLAFKPTINLKLFEDSLFKLLVEGEIYEPNNGYYQILEVKETENKPSIKEFLTYPMKLDE